MVLDRTEKGNTGIEISDIKMIYNIKRIYPVKRMRTIHKAANTNEKLQQINQR